MMEKKKVCFSVNTEYHLLVSINEMLTRYNSGEHQVHFMIKRSSRSNKMAETLDLDSLPVTYEVWDHGITFDAPLTEQKRERVNGFIAQKWDEFIFFQEQDPLMIILINELAPLGTKIYLYQDGLKPYVTINYHSLSLIKNDIRVNRWIRKNGYQPEPILSFLHCKNYAFLRNVQKVFLTFPERYNNWNNKEVEKFDLEISTGFRDVLRKVFRWEESLLEQRNRVIFYLNQPMHDDGEFERKLLSSISTRFAGYPFYIKLHPLTPKTKLDKYRLLDNVRIIESSIPAELFISHLTESVILSICSTSMFIDNPRNKFYWLNEVAQTHIKRLKRYRVINPTKHIVSAKSLEEISF